jgi:hypothetical protein
MFLVDVSGVCYGYFFHHTSYSYLRLVDPKIYYRVASYAFDDAHVGCSFVVSFFPQRYSIVAPCPWPACLQLVADLILLFLLEITKPTSFLLLGAV